MRSSRVMGAWLALAAVLGLGPAHGAESAFLSWSPADRSSNVTDAFTGAGTAYLTVIAAGPVDSLGFNLRWAARRPDAELTVRGLRPFAETDASEQDRPAGADAWQRHARPEASDENRLTMLHEWLSDPGFLATLGAEGPSGEIEYRLAIDFEMRGAGSVRIEATNVTVQYAGGERRQLGSPAISVGDGWMLRLPPVITSVEGVLNRRFLQSVIWLEGNDLDRVVELTVVDVNGKRVHPLSVESRSREHLELRFTNRSFDLGPARLVYRDAECVTDSVDNALVVKVLEEAQSGDTNMGTVPGSER